MKKIKKRKDIQIYRGIAVLSVIFYHIDSELFSSGFLGVDVFFIISGFVISNLIYSDLSQNSFYLKKFYFQRFRRIFPSLVTFILFVQILIYFFLDHQFIYQTSRANLFAYFFVSNIYFSQIIDYFNNAVPRNFVINLWSLSVEEQFYLLFPILAIFTKKYSTNKKIFVFFLLTVASIVFYKESIFFSFSFLKKIFFTHNNYIFYSPFTRVWQFSIGVISMFLNQKYLNKKIQISEASFLTIQIVLIYFLFNKFNFLNKNIQLTLVMITFSFLLVRELEIKTNKNKLIKFLIFTGNISYSLYLFHQPVFASIRNYNYYASYKFEFTFQNWEYFNVLYVLLIVYLISFLNYLFIEKRYRAIEFFSIKEFKWLLILLLVSLCLIFLSFSTNGYSFRDSKVATFNNDTNLEFVQGTNYISQETIQCIDRDSIQHSCKFNTQNTNEIYIIGDSIMSSIVSGFIENPTFKEYKIIEFTRGGCPLLVQKCNFIEGYSKYMEILEIKESIIFIGGNYLQYFDSPTFASDLITTVKLIAKNNKVYFFSSFPNPGVNIRMYKLINNDLPDVELNSYETQDPIIDILEKTSIQNLTIINSKDIFCEQITCKYVDNSKYYFIDHVHFSYYGAEIISQYVTNNFFK